MKKISVLFLIDTFESIGGTEKHLEQLVTRIDKSRFNPIVCCFRGGVISNNLEKKGIRTYNFNVKKLTIMNLLRQTSKLYTIVRNGKVGIIMTYFECSDFLGLLVGRMAGVSIIISNRRDMGHL